MAFIALAAGVVVVYFLLGRPDRSSAADPGPVHVHALGVNPADGALFIATHTGLYRLERSTATARRVTDRRQDTMGFTVVGGDRFLGSGHLDLRAELPPLLGLIDSRDAGRTWSPISLVGEADFHVLRAQGKRIVGYDATNGRILISRDGGRGWSAQVFRGPLVDLVPDLAGSETLLATATDSRMHAALHSGVIKESTDGGKSWRAVVSPQ